MGTSKKKRKKKSNRTTKKKQKKKGKKNRPWQKRRRFFARTVERAFPSDKASRRPVTAGVLDASCTSNLALIFFGSPFDDHCVAGWASRLVYIKA
jgi:hypothetical protein